MEGRLCTLIYKNSPIAIGHLVDDVQVAPLIEANGLSAIDDYKGIAGEEGSGFRGGCARAGTAFLRPLSLRVEASTIG